MNAACAANRVQIHNILFATDFSEASQSALTYALLLARGYGATIHAWHVVTPQAYMCATPEGTAGFAAIEESIQEEMEKVACRLSGVRNEVVIERGSSISSAMEEIIQRRRIDLVVVGTHGRTGIRKILLGSTAEAIFRKARVPVLTIGPAVTEGAHSGGKYRCVLYATDLREDSLRAAAFAFSIAEENGARLVLLHVAPKRPGKDRERLQANDKYSSAASILHEMHELIPMDAETWCRPEVMLKFGEPVKQILDTATEKGADLIVMGTHRMDAYLPAATHQERGVSYNVVARSKCPVLTVRE